jgi:hypothetical protein
MKRIFSLMAVAALLLPAACASSGGDAVYRQNMGLATQRDAEMIVDRVFAQSGYTIHEETEPPNLMWRSEWRDRDPFPDERLEGIVNAETRLTVSGRQGTDGIGMEGIQYFRLTFSVENRTRTSDGEWDTSRNSPMLLEYLESIHERFEEELRTIGVRRY